MSFNITDPSYNTSLEAVISALDGGNSGTETLGLYKIINGTYTDIGSLLASKSKNQSSIGTFKPTGYKYLYGTTYYDVSEKLNYYSFSAGSPKVSLNFNGLNTIPVVQNTYGNTIYNTYYVTRVTGTSGTININYIKYSYYTPNTLTTIPIYILLVGGGGAGGYAINDYGGGGGGGAGQILSITKPITTNTTITVSSVGSGGLFDSLDNTLKSAIGGIDSYILSYDESLSNNRTIDYNTLTGDKNSSDFGKGGNTSITIDSLIYTSQGGNRGLYPSYDDNDYYLANGGDSYDLNGNIVLGGGCGYDLGRGRGGNGANYYGSTYENKYVYIYDGKNYASGGQGGNRYNGYTYNIYGSGGYGGGFYGASYYGSAGTNGIIAISIPSQYI